MNAIYTCPLDKGAINPSRDQECYLQSLGFSFEPYPDTDIYKIINLPAGYKWIDRAWRKDKPDKYIVDKNGVAVVNVIGSWKETHDNELITKTYQHEVIFISAESSQDLLKQGSIHKNENKKLCKQAIDASFDIIAEKNVKDEKEKAKAEKERIKRERPVYHLWSTGKFHK